MPVRTTKVILFVSVLFVLGAYIAYEGVKAQMKPTGGRSEGTRVMNTSERLQAMLRDFLIGAAKNDPAAHDRFWADDLIYTSAKGIVKTKAEIMKSVREEAAKPVDSNAKATYDAEDVTVRDFGDFAVMNFRLVAHIEEQGKKETSYYRNTGTFANRNGEWRVVGWQATKIEK